MLRLAFDFIITWRETRTRPNAYQKSLILIIIIVSKRRPEVNLSFVVGILREIISCC